MDYKFIAKYKSQLESLSKTTEYCGKYTLSAVWVVANVFSSKAN